mmetsp:Transcript_93565/g.166465  ORF Transcript_93565/g.166465 Transcript_93565/m.166465 type:complete len:254 (+) Transcript_93565:66-827(+)
MPAADQDLAEICLDSDEENHEQPAAFLESPEAAEASKASPISIDADEYRAVQRARRRARASKRRKEVQDSLSRAVLLESDDEADKTTASLSEEELRQHEVEQYRQAERQKRKALWSNVAIDPRSASPEGDERPSANGWESSRFENSDERAKFLRLMGGKKIVEAEARLLSEEELPSGCQTLELCKGSWVHILEEERLAAAAPEVEQSTGWIGSTTDTKASSAAQYGVSRDRELERQYLAGVTRVWKRRGLGAR